MKRALLLSLVALALGAGCGDPAPSTPLAPDVPAPDTSKFSAKDIQQFKESDRGTPPDRQATGR